MPSRPRGDLGLAHILRQRLLSFCDSVAVEQGQSTLTFNEVHHRALSIARELQIHSLQKEQPVAILARRGIYHILCTRSFSTPDQTTFQGIFAARQQRYAVELAASPWFAFLFSFSAGMRGRLVVAYPV